MLSGAPWALETKQVNKILELCHLIGGPDFGRSQSRLPLHALEMSISNLIARK